jgi:acyl-CoA oxidase
MEQRKKNVPALLKLTPSNVPSKTSGGTADFLPNERKNASFDTQDMIHYLNGGAEMTKKRKFIESVITKDPEDLHRQYNYDRHEYIQHHVKDFIRIHKPFKNYRPTREEISYMSHVSIGFGALNNSHWIFLNTILGQGNEEQIKYWYPKIMNFELTGSYAQTELGHGSNVRGLQTIAEYDKATDSFILNTPTLTSMKWWPGCLGKVATHVVLYAQLLINGKEYGVNVFVLQIRDENHLPLSGIRLGDLGNKMGDNANDTGFMLLENVRIPRTHLLSKYRTVNAEGKFVDLVKSDSKVHYTTMMTARANMVSTSAARLAQCSTIAIRYSCVREQGFVDNSDSSYRAKENKIIDHKIQQYRLLKQLSGSYALKFTGTWMLEQLRKMEGKDMGVITNPEMLKELAGTSAGLKSLTTIMATNGIEDLRKCCGGNGYLLSTGISALSQDYLWQVTAEGDFIILAMLTAKSLLKSIQTIFNGKKLTGIVDYFNIIGESGFNLAQLKPNPVTRSDDLCSLPYLLSLFKYRTLEKNYILAKDFTDFVKKTQTKTEEAYNVFSNELLVAGHAHCYYIIMNNFVNKINECQNLKIKHVLTRLCILFACSHFLDENWGDILSKEQFRHIRDRTYAVMKEIRPDAVSLVDAFDFSDFVVKSSIGRYDGNVYEALFDAAQKSILNQIDPFLGYEEYLKPHLNKDILKKGNVPIEANAKL